MSQNLECREYAKMIELAFDFERALNIDVITNVFFHFHKSTFKNKSVKPYMIKLTMPNETRNLSLMHIVNALHYIPTYIIERPTSTDFAYVDFSNNIKLLSANSSFMPTLLTYFNESSTFESTLSTNMIDKSIIDPIRELLKSVDITIDEDYNYIHIPNIDVHIMKIDGKSNNLTNVINPSNIVAYEDIMCIGSFVRFNNKNISKQNDLALALVTYCDQCKTPMIINYESSLICPECKCVVQF